MTTLPTARSADDSCTTINSKNLSAICAACQRRITQDTHIIENPASISLFLCPDCCPICGAKSESPRET